MAIPEQTIKIAKMLQFVMENLNLIGVIDPFANLEQGSFYNVNTQDAQGNTLLHYAHKKNDRPSIEFLIAIGADHSIKNHAGHMPNTLTLSAADIAGIAFITEDEIANFINGSEHAAPHDINSTDINGNTLLHHAYRLNAQQAVETLLRMGARTDIKNNLGFLPNDPFLLPAGMDATTLFQSIGAIEKLLQTKNINATDAEGNTLLHYAYQQNATSEVIKFLIESGAKLSILQDDKPRLRSFLTDNSIAYIMLSDTWMSKLALFMEKNQDVEDIINQRIPLATPGITLLEGAIRYENLKAVEDLLVLKGARPTAAWNRDLNNDLIEDTVHWFENTALYMAAQHGPEYLAAVIPFLQVGNAHDRRCAELVLDSLHPELEAERAALSQFIAAEPPQGLLMQVLSTIWDTIKSVALAAWNVVAAPFRQADAGDTTLPQEASSRHANESTPPEVDSSLTTSIVAEASIDNLTRVAPVAEGTGTPSRRPAITGSTHSE